jgi:hypothetical protein
VPEISRFFGIIIAIFFDDHNPPHFHARYGDNNGVIKIDNFALIEGFLPPRALGLVIEWAEIHKEELLINWKRASESKDLFSIESLK